jgi:environmental stress-induced protein Ves
MLDPSGVAAVPWRNGAGATRELAVATDPGGATLWRISLAALDQDAPFSRFPGMERLLVALGPLRLSVDRTVVEMVAGGQLRFAGEVPVAVALDEPTQALNVMTRRGRCRAEVVLRPAGTAAVDRADVTVRLGDLLADVRLDLVPEEGHSEETPDT